MRGLLKEILANPVAMALAILVHVVLGGILLVSLEWTSTPLPSQPKVDIVKAVAVDEKKIQEELDKLKKAEAKKKKKEQDKQRRLDKKAKAAEKKRKDAEKKRKLEEKRLAKLRKEQAAEKKRLAKERDEKKKEVERIKAERLAEEKALAEAEAKRKQLEDKKRREAEAAAMREAIAAEQAALEKENQKRLSSLRGQYLADIAAKVERNWIRPASARQGLSCEVKVNQIPGGEVINVRVTKCIGDDVFRRSVESAVYKASPLPRPSDPALFDRDIVFTFKPKFK